MLDNREKMSIGLMHIAGHVMRPPFLHTCSLEDVPIIEKEALRTSLKQFYGFSTDVAANVQKAMASWEKLVNKEAPYVLVDNRAEPAVMWTEAAAVHRAGRDDKRWYQMHVGAAGEGKELFNFFSHVNDLRLSEAGCERAYSVIAHVQDGRESLSYDKLEALTHIFWNYRLLESDHHKRRMKKLDEVFQEALHDLLAYEDAEQDAAFEHDGAAHVETPAEQLMNALGLSPDDAETSPAASPMQKHAELASPKLIQLSSHLDGGPDVMLRSAISACPVFEEMCKLTVTAKTLSSNLLGVLKTLRPYRTHEDPIVSMQVKQLLGAWKQVFKEGSASTHFCANDILKPPQQSASSADPAPERRLKRRLTGKQSDPADPC